MVAGCGTGLGSGSEVIDGNRDISATSPLGKTSGEPNDMFAQAVVAVFDDAGVARLQGTVADSGDLDVFLLGSLLPGDRVIVDTATTGSALDTSVAIFDGAGRLVYNNDDRGGTSSRFLDAYIDWIVRHAADRYYLVVTRSPFSGSLHLSGKYTVEVEVTMGLDVPEPVGQVLVLDFDGATIDTPGLGRLALEPLDAGAISPFYAGETELLKETIRMVFEQNFERFDVIIRTTDDPPLADGTLFSTVYFGGLDRDVFGIAERVDLYNADCCDDAIIFAETFGPRVFSTVPTTAELGIAIGNIGTHEAGHLLGLNHVDDDMALMDDESHADAFIEDQEFKQAPLSGDIMSIGVQDAVLLLDEIVGPVPF